MPEPFHALTPADLLPREQAAAMTGIEFLTGMLEGRLPAPPITRTLNFRLHEVGPGRVEFRGVPGFEVMNPIGTVHGGWYGTLLDSCMACAVMSRLERGQAYTTLEFKVNIIRPIPLGLEVAAVGEVSHVGRSTGVAEGRLVGVADGRLFATGSTTCLVMSV
ncbi:MAG TPA: PaaI family thioesterase [Paracoccaceae bacterium]|nr:PaaI family thioesterase [Paracoccaceae bacterium]